MVLKFFLEIWREKCRLFFGAKNPIGTFVDIGHELRLGSYIVGLRSGGVSRHLEAVLVTYLRQLVSVVTRVHLRHL
jgi:hypothetical protein